MECLLYEIIKWDDTHLLIHKNDDVRGLFFHIRCEFICGRHKKEKSYTNIHIFLFDTFHHIYSFNTVQNEKVSP